MANGARLRPATFGWFALVAVCVLGSILMWNRENRFGSGTVGDRILGRMGATSLLFLALAVAKIVLGRLGPREQGHQSAPVPISHEARPENHAPPHPSRHTTLIPLDMLKRDVGIAACLRDADEEATSIRQRGDLTAPEKAELAAAVRAKADARRAEILDMDQTALATMIDALRHRADFAEIEASVRRSAGQTYVHVRLT